MVDVDATTRRRDRAAIDDRRSRSHATRRRGPAMTLRQALLAALDGRSGPLYLLAGGLLLAFAAETGLRTFVGTGVPVLHDVVGPAGFWVGILGLLGLAPVLTAAGGRLVRVGAAIAVVPAVGWAVIVVWGLAETAGVVGAMAGPVVAVPIASFLGLMLAYLVTGLGTLRSDALPTHLGVMLLLPALVFVLLVARLGTEFVIDLSHALVHLSIGVALVTGGLHAADRPVDATSPADS